MEEQRLTIDRLGHRGDGIVLRAGAPVYVTGALPGEEVKVDMIAKDRARLVAVLSPSEQRVTPPCPHFDICGGCQAQHMETGLYRAWKVEGIVTALRQQRIEAVLSPLRAIAPLSRRRARLALKRVKGKAVLGFHSARSEDVVEVPACQVMRPAITEALPALAHLLAPLAPQRGDIAVSVLETSAGLDVAVDAPRGKQGQMSRLFADAGAAGLARLSVGGESIAFRTPMIGRREAERHVPPGGFTQAVAAVEETLADLAAAALSQHKKVLELFCGSGAFTLPLARASCVHAVEGDRPALAALQQSLRSRQGLKPVTIEERDLFRRPFMTPELKPFDAVLLDPPRQGAQAQMTGLATSKLSRIVYISCAPASFARDARLLIDGGYRLASLTPIDQFLWSHHVEIFSIFER